MLFFWKFLLCVGQGRNETIFFIFSLSQPFPTYFGLKWCHKGVFKFFCYFFGIFYYASGRDETKRYFLFSLFLSLFQPILVSIEAIKVFFNFLNFFAIFLEFSIMRKDETKRYFLFSQFLSLFQPILAWNEAIKVFFNFLNFFAIFFEFSIRRLVRTKRNDNFYFSLFLSILQSISALNEAIREFFLFFECFCYLFGIFSYVSGKDGAER